jgi:hypothetical protein
MDYSSYSMPEAHDLLFHQIINTPADKELPEKIQAEYWKYKRVCDRASIRVIEQDLARICAALGYGDKADEKEVDITELWKKGVAKYDDPVLVQWGNTNRKGAIKNVTASGDVVVVLNGEGEERKMKPSKIRLAEVAGV